MDSRPLLKDKAKFKGDKELPVGQEKASSSKEKDLALILSGSSHIKIEGALGDFVNLARSVLSSDKKKEQGDVSTSKSIIYPKAESSISPIEELHDDGYLIVQHPKSTEISEHIEMDIEQDFHLITKVERSVPNNPDAYRKEMILEGYLPVPPQNLWDRLCNYYSPNRQKTEALIKIKEIEDNRDRYKSNLNKESIEEIGLAIEMAKRLFEPEIQRTERYLKNIKNTIPEKEYKEIKEKKFKEFKENIIKCSSEILERFSGNADRANEVLVSDLESLSKKQSKQAQLFKLNSLIKMNGLGLRL